MIMIRDMIMMEVRYDHDKGYDYDGLRLLGMRERVC